MSVPEAWENLHVVLVNAKAGRGRRAALVKEIYDTATTQAFLLEQSRGSNDDWERLIEETKLNLQKGLREYRGKRRVQLNAKRRREAAKQAEKKWGSEVVERIDEEEEEIEEDEVVEEETLSDDDDPALQALEKSVETVKLKPVNASENNNMDSEVVKPTPPSREKRSPPPGPAPPPTTENTITMVSPSISPSSSVVTTTATVDSASPENKKPPPPASPKPVSVWRSAVDPSSGMTYYYNRKTKETKWERPPDFEPPAADRKISTDPLPAPDIKATTAANDSSSNVNLNSTSINNNNNNNTRRRSSSSARREEKKAELLKLKEDMRQLQEQQQKLLQQQQQPTAAAASPSPSSSPSTKTGTETPRQIPVVPPPLDPVAPLLFTQAQLDAAEDPSLPAEERIQRLMIQRDAFHHELRVVRNMVDILVEENASFAVANQELQRKIVVLTGEDAGKGGAGGLSLRLLCEAERRYRAEQECTALRGLVSAMEKALEHSVHQLRDFRDVASRAGSVPTTPAMTPRI